MIVELTSAVTDSVVTVVLVGSEMKVVAGNAVLDNFGNGAAGVGVGSSDVKGLRDRA